MTTQVLMSTSVIAPPSTVALPYEPVPERTPNRVGFNSTAPVAEPTPLKRTVPIAERLVAPSSCPLPQAASSPTSGRSAVRPLLYQANHQAELLCLQAEVDALWHHLQAIQQERQALASQASGKTQV